MVRGVPAVRRAAPGRGSAASSHPCSSPREGFAHVSPARGGAFTRGPGTPEGKSAGGGGSWNATVTNAGVSRVRVCGYLTVRIERGGGAQAVPVRVRGETQE
ncbi:predicted protein [Streptomyces sp. SPB78]|nr:predicted protein [Streptomyces sp. SPB78]